MNRWLNETKLHTVLSVGNRGMELSEVIKYNGKLYAMCDKTGIVYEILPSNKAIQRFAVSDGACMCGWGLCVCLFRIILLRFVLIARRQWRRIEGVSDCLLLHGLCILVCVVLISAAVQVRVGDGEGR